MASPTPTPRRLIAKPLDEVREQKAVPPSTHLLAGASGGLVTSIVTSPLDVLRTRLQSDFYRHSFHSDAPQREARSPQSFGPSPQHARGTVQIIKSIRYTEGWAGFFRGLGPSLAGVVPATAVKFYVYGNCKRLGARLLQCGEDAAIVHAQAAVAAGVATSTVTNPIWLVKTRLQLDKSRMDVGSASSRRYRNSIDCIRQVVQQEGIGGLYRGLSASYIGSVETVIHLVLYERLKLVYGRALGGANSRGLTTSSELATWACTSGAAGSAKVAAVLLTYPHEVIRTRLRQAPSENGVLKYQGLLQCFRSIAKREGVAGLYGGLMPHMMRSIPSAVITLGVYEFVLRLVSS